MSTRDTPSSELRQQQATLSPRSRHTDRHEKDLSETIRHNHEKTTKTPIAPTSRATIANSKTRGSDTLPATTNI